MSVPTYNWPSEGKFVGREGSLAQLEKWWAEDDALPINLYGRRRVGKTWLFRKFAHGKPAVILVALKTTRSPQLSTIADELKDVLGVKPEIKSIEDLFTILYNMATTEKILVIIDEFPKLLGTTNAEIETSLQAVARVNENLRDNSKIKLILCGSALTEMASMQDKSSPMYNRLHKFELTPLTFAESRPFFSGSNILDHFTRYSVAGGMPKYLTLLSKGADFAKVLVDEVVTPNSPMYSEVSALLEAELDEASVYFAILAELSVSPKEIGKIAEGIGQESKKLGTYIARLEALRIVEAKQPAGSDPKARNYQYRCTDGYIRFWFRYVWPYKHALEAGSDPQMFVKKHIMPTLADHSSLEFELTLQRWITQNYTDAADVRNWWGKAAKLKLPKGIERTKEEIDVVALKGKKVLVLGEAKWQNLALKIAVPNNLETYKVPALVAAGLKVPDDRVVVLASRGGFTKEVRDLAVADARVILIDAVTLLQEVK